MAFVEDRSVFFDVDGHAIAATYTPKNYAHPSAISRTVNVIFDKGYTVVNGVESYSPHILADESDLTDIAHDAKFRIEGVDYKVKGSQPDGTGLIDVVLEKI